MGATAVITVWNMVLIQGYTFFKKSQSHLKIVGARRVAWIKFHTEDQQIVLGTNTKFGHPGFVYPFTSQVFIVSCHSNMTDIIYTLYLIG